MRLLLIDQCDSTGFVGVRDRCCFAVIEGTSSGPFDQRPVDPLSVVTKLDYAHASATSTCITCSICGPNAGDGERLVAT